MQHRREIAVATTAVLVEDKAKHVRLRKLRLATKAAEFRIECAGGHRQDLVDDRAGERAGMRAASLSVVQPKLRHALIHLRTPVAVDVRDLR